MNVSRIKETKLKVLGTAALLICFLAISITYAGISGTGFSRGRISHFGSIFVNAREFDTDTAIVIIDGQLASTTDLRLGQTVFVTGVVDNQLPIGTATEVHVSTAVAGPISAIDASAQQMTVLGKTILTDSDTVVSTLSNSGDFSAFSAGNMVSISGMRMSDGSLLATRIEELSTVGENQIAGKISNLSGASFELDESSVNAGTAQILGFPGGVLVDQANVFVRSSSFGPNGELIATTVELLPAIVGTEYAVGELEGLIDNFSTAESFTIDNVPVAGNAQTGFIGGGAANLTRNSNVIVRGKFDANGTLVAKEIEIRGTRIRLSGQVQSLSGQSLNVLGIPLHAITGLGIEDKSDADIEPFSLADLSVGDFVEVRTEKNPPATLPVSIERLERADYEQTIELRGYVSLVSGNSIQVLGASIYTGGLTEFFDAEGEEISATSFYSSVSAGTYVDVRGAESSQSNVVATRISLQLDD